MIITIDGPAAAGKGTLANKLAQKYGLAYFDTGMVYRAVGLDMILQHFDISDESQAEKIAQNMTFSHMIELSKHPDFRSNIGGEAASKVAAMPKVRLALLKMQQDFALDPEFADGIKAKGVVYDGRDTGTTICPNADIKFFITASPEVRATRRYKEFLSKGMNISFEEVLSQTRIRDERDSSRSSSPMTIAEGAIIVDTSDLDIDQVFEQVCKIVNNKK